MIAKFRRRLKSLVNNPNRKQITIVFAIFFCIYMINSSSNTASNDLAKSEGSPILYLLKFAESMNDHTVNTEFYLEEYSKRRKALADTITKRDAQYKQFKTILKDARKTNLNSNSYLIVEYTKVFKETKFCQHFVDDKLINPDMFLDECPYKNCVFSCDERRAATADALLFSEFDLSREDTEKTYYLKQFLGKTYKRVDQIWILWNDEVIAFNNLNIFI